MSILDTILQRPYTQQFQAMQPESPAVTAPVVPTAGSSIPVAATAAPAQSKRHGILGAIADFLAPEAGSFWAEAFQNGLAGAKTGQLAFQQGQAKSASDLKTAEVDRQYKAAQAQRELAQADHERNKPDIAGNNVVETNPDGTHRFIAPPVQSTETERLIDKWHAAIAAGDKMSAMMYERAIKGYQYSPEVIQQQGNARTATVVAGKKAQRFAPKSSSTRSSGVTLPSGAVVIK